MKRYEKRSKDMNRKELAKALKIAREKEQQKIPVDVTLLNKFSLFYTDDFKITKASIREVAALIRWFFAKKFTVKITKRNVAYTDFKDIVFNKIKISQ
jgi:hypothetical protein